MSDDSVLAQLLRTLQVERGDTSSIEVKSAAGGLPSDVGRSLCALANLPGGGWLILGLAEDVGAARDQWTGSGQVGGATFRPVGLTDPQVL